MTSEKCEHDYEISYRKWIFCVKCLKEWTLKQHDEEIRQSATKAIFAELEEKEIYDTNKMIPKGLVRLRDIVELRKKYVVEGRTV